MKAVQNQVYQV